MSKPHVTLETLGEGCQILHVGSHFVVLTQRDRAVVRELLDEDSARVKKAHSNGRVGRARQKLRVAR